MKIFCVGRNYSEHAKELNNPLPEEPVIFTKPPTALIKGHSTFYYPDFSKDVHFEGEIVLRINKNGKNIQEKFAHKYYDQVTFGIDFTARDVQSKLKAKGLPWDLAKGFDGAAALGEFIPLEEALRGESILFRTVQNGNTVQQGNTADMIFSFDKVIAFVSSYFTLQTGDLIFTGTPAGVGPIAIGDKLEGFIGDKQVLRCEVK